MVDDGYYDRKRDDQATGFIRDYALEQASYERGVLVGFWFGIAVSLVVVGLIAVVFVPLI